MKSFCIIGLGNFGTTLARTLTDNGHQVSVIDKDEEKIDEIAEQLKGAKQNEDFKQEEIR